MKKQRRIKRHTHQFGKIINADWKEYFPRYRGRRANLLYTDPPYGMNYKCNMAGDKRWNKTGISNSKFEKIKGDDKQIEWDVFAPMMHDLLEDDSFAFIHCNIPMISHMYPAMLDAGFNYSGRIIWDKVDCRGGSLTTGLRNPCEEILFFSKGKPAWREIEVMRNGERVKRKRICSHIDWKFPIPKNEYYGHPTQKPIDLCKQVIKLTTDKGDLVLEPFAGVAPIPIACGLLDREFIATELDPKYHRLAIQRYREYMQRERRGTIGNEGQFNNSLFIPLKPSEEYFVEMEIVFEDEYEDCRNK